MSAPRKRCLCGSQDARTWTDDEDRCSIFCPRCSRKVRGDTEARAVAAWNGSIDSGLSYRRGTIL